AAAAGHLLRVAQRRHPDDFWLNFDLAEALLNQKPGNASAAVGFLRGALSLRPGDPTILSSLGVAFRKLAAWQEAKEALDAAIASRPNAPAFHFNLANVFLDQHKSVEAEQERRTAIALEPGYAEAHWNLGLALQKQKRYAEGLVEYREGHRLGKNKPDWPIRSDFWVRHYEHQERMARLLLRVETGEAQP